MVPDLSLQVNPINVQKLDSAFAGRLARFPKKLECGVLISVGDPPHHKIGSLIIVTS